MAMKICKECGSEVSSKGVCPKCGKDQRNFFVKHKVVTFILVVFVLGVLFGTSSNDNAPKTTLNNETNGGTTTTTTKEYSVGEIYEDNYIAIKYVSLDENFTGYSRYASVKDGYKVIRAEFEFENLSTSDNYVSSYDFDCYADGYDCESFYSADDYGFSATLSTGKKTKGAVYFEVPKDATSIVLEYELNIWTDKRIEFIVK